MKTEIEAAVVKDLQDRELDTRTKKLRYLPGSALFDFFEGQLFAFRDLALQIRQGDYQPIQAKGGG